MTPSHHALSIQEKLDLVTRLLDRISIHLTKEIKYHAHNKEKGALSRGAGDYIQELRRIRKDLGEINSVIMRGKATTSVIRTKMLDSAGILISDSDHIGGS